MNLAHSVSPTSIEVYEWNESDIRRKRLPNAPDINALTTKHKNLAFSGCKLAHAIVKADYLDRRNLTMPGIGFLMQACGVINFSTSTIELLPGASSALNDISLSSMAGRVGHGLAILYGHSLGMKFAAHLLSHVESLPPTSVGAAHKEERMADFLFSNNNQSILIEAKGSFRLEENNPSKIKSVLKDALQAQVDPWMKYLQPAPSNGYVLYSCLREGHWEPSAMFVVDPEGEVADGPTVPLTIEQVMRENYSAWLNAMGLGDSAQRLLNPSMDAEVSTQKLFAIVEMYGRKFAFYVDFDWLKKIARCQENAWYSGTDLELLLWLFHFSKSSPMVGIDLEVLKVISLVIHDRQATLQDLLSQFQGVEDVFQDGFSVFPDGSVFGEVCGHPVGFERFFV